MNTRVFIVEDEMVLNQQLSAFLQNVREEQNAYLSREIHDVIGQLLTVLDIRSTPGEGTRVEARVPLHGGLDESSEEREGEQ